VKKLVMAALVSAQLVVAAEPVAAADLVAREGPQMGAFAGLRLHVPLDATQRRPIRAGLAIAPTMARADSEGVVRSAIGEGFELGISGRQPPRLFIAGQDLRRLGAAQQNGEQEGERHGGPSTLGWVAIGAGALILVTATAGYFVFEDMMDCDPGDDCS